MRIILHIPNASPEAKFFGVTNGHEYEVYLCSSGTVYITKEWLNDGHGVYLPVDWCIVIDENVLPKELFEL